MSYFILVTEHKEDAGRIRQIYCGLSIKYDRRVVINTRKYSRWYNLKKILFCFKVLKGVWKEENDNVLS